ncbi:unnamed protein product [Mucor hiemalis]
MTSLKQMTEHSENALGETKTVPPKLPPIQWTGQSFDPSRQIAADLKGALRLFEDVLNQRKLSLGGNWRRLITTFISPEHRSWLDDELSPRVIHWEQFKAAFTKAFGTDRIEERNTAASALMKFTMIPGESFEEYKRRFFELKSKAEDTVRKEFLAQLRSKFHCMSTYTLCRSFSSLSTDMSFQPYTIWTLYNYDSNQSSDSQSQKLSLIFQSIALAVIEDGVNARVEMNTFRSLYGQLNDNKIKEIIKQILNMYYKLGSVLINR